MNGPREFMLGRVSQTKIQEPYHCTHMWDIKLKAINKKNKGGEKKKLVKGIVYIVIERDLTLGINT